MRPPYPRKPPKRRRPAVEEDGSHRRNDGAVWDPESKRWRDPIRVKPRKR